MLLCTPLATRTQMPERIPDNVLAAGRASTPHPELMYRAQRASIPSAIASPVSLKLWSTALFVAVVPFYTSVKLGDAGLRERFSEHLRSIRNHSPGFPVAEHFNSATHSLDDITVCGLKQCSGGTSRKQQEMRLIFEIGSLSPSGLNINFSII